MRTKLTLLIVLSLLITTGCGPKISAPTTPGGGDVSLAVYFDRGLDGKTPEEQVQLNELGKWMAKDLVKTYKDAGYAVQKIKTTGDFQPSPGHYLLTVKTVKFSPGSKAAKTLLNTGANLFLDIHYELLGEDGQIISKDHGRGSTRTWQILAEQLNQDMLMEITPALGGSVEI